MRVSWEEAVAYCEWARLSLPTEVQWEYACRAGTTTRYHSGDGEEDLARVGWYGGNSGRRLHAVAELEPNGFGLYDMHGNVYEWCQDTWVGSYAGTVHQPGDGLRTQPGGDSDRVVRGGDFVFGPRFARSAYRAGLVPGYRIVDVGFRVVQGHSG
ncbi:MAG: formylglycine-generating enzyme family protein [Myxococcales bacterium]|nr:formylglycine-generating enzyme family protein [Myxococcales bacterium]